MAPKKPGAGGGESDRFPLMKLEYKKGSVSGKTDVFKPGSTIHIGRIVHGNTLTIKDAGISSKHLRIQVESATNLATAGWAITDLGSSNGTNLNGEQLEPTVPALLSDGYVIKIGEETSITVRFEAMGHVNVADSTNLRRSTRQKARKQAGDLGAIEKLPEGRRTRADTRRKNIAKEEMLVEVKEDVELDVKHQVYDPAGSGSTSGVKDGNADDVAEGRRTRADTRRKNIAKEMLVEVVKENVELDVKHQVCYPAGSGSTSGVKDGNADGVAEGRRTRADTRRTNIAKEEMLVEVKEDVELDVKHQVYDPAGSGSTYVVKDGNADDVGNGNAVVDLEKMTLGEWLDQLEVILPQQVIHETEGMIAEMKQKAARLHEFMMQKKNAKCR